MNLKEIKELIALMNENNLTEIEMERDGLKIRLKKGVAGISSEIVPSEMPAPVAPAPEVRITESRVEEIGKKTVQIKSPMVGTFYRAPSPEAAPFVEAGTKVEIGQVVCIVEAMKLMNEIKSEVKGKVVEILAEDGEPVEFGQALFIIEPV
jgi:acetyl-CoA carboxylase biotin carboxyl carrier protein